MDKQELQIFLNIIDSRIKKYINENKLLRQYCGQVTKVISNKKCEVRLLGDELSDEMVFTFLNKSGETLSVGNYVYIQTVGTDLNTGVIVYKAGE